nr:MAG TPA: hypothetical protein [Caudoviricetes sp.]
MNLCISRGGGMRQAVYEKVVCGYIQDVCNLHEGF